MPLCHEHFYPSILLLFYFIWLSHEVFFFFLFGLRVMITHKKLSLLFIFIFSIEKPLPSSFHIYFRLHSAHLGITSLSCLPCFQTRVGNASLSLFSLSSRPLTSVPPCITMIIPGHTRHSEVSSVAVTTESCSHVALAMDITVSGRKGRARKGWGVGWMGVGVAGCFLVEAH